MNNNCNARITIGRQFGSGGRQIGRAIADALGIDFYDKNLMTEAARHAGINPDLFERKDEKAPSFFSGLLSYNMGYSAYNLLGSSSSITDDALYRAQTEVIRSLAEKGPCVIVGRSADYALRDRDDVINIFIHAPLEERIRRIMERGDASTREQARQIAERSNKLRASYYNFYTDKRWGKAESYDLTFDSSLLSTEDIVELVKKYVELRNK
ncbi:MAG: cytidylate kinase-like family protein [Muribaculaceae bacterium]|nr:cytidylate kinase-like family protein [Muribaculaceae bacterium]